MSSRSRNKIYIVLFVIAIFQEGLGLRKMLGGGIGTGTFGFFFFLQILAVIILILPLFFRNKRLFYGKNNILYKPMVFLFILFIIAILYSIYELILFSSLPIKVLYNISNLKFYLLFFLMIHWIENIEQLKFFLKGLIVMGLIASIIVLLSLFYGKTDLSVISFQTSNEIGRQFRLMIPTGMLVAYCFFILFSKILYQYNTKFYIYNFILIAIFFTVFILQMHRNVLAAIFTVLLIVSFYTPKLNFNKIVIKYFIVFVMFIFFVVILFFLNLDTSSIINIYNYSKSQFVHQEGNLWFRLITLYNTITYIWKNNFLFGIGFNWQSSDFLTYYTTQFNMGPTNDNSYTNIIIVYGFSGVLVYFYLFVKLFRSFFTLLKKTKDIFIRYITYSNFLFLISILVISTGSDNLIIYSNTTMTVVLFAVVYLVNSFETKTHKM